MPVNQRVTYSVFVLAVSILLIATLFIPYGKDVLLINGHHHLVLDQLSPWITELGNAVVYLPVFLILFFVRLRWVSALALAGILHGAVVLIFKRLLFSDALRPTGVLDITLLHMVPGVKVHSLMSFPSGHTATVFAFMLLLSLYSNNRWLSIIFGLLAVLTGLSRIYLLQHFLIDVTAGAVIGTASAWAAYTLMSRMKWSWLDLRITFSLRRVGVQDPTPAQG